MKQNIVIIFLGLLVLILSSVLIYNNVKECPKCSENEVEKSNKVVCIRKGVIQEETKTLIEDKVEIKFGEDGIITKYYNGTLRVYVNEDAYKADLNYFKRNNVIYIEDKNTIFSYNDMTKNYEGVWYKTVTEGLTGQNYTCN